MKVTKYSKDVWKTFVVPADFDESCETLPIYTKKALSAGSVSILDMTGKQVYSINNINFFIK